MVLAFTALSIILYVVSHIVWRDQNYIGLKSNLIALTLGFAAFNALLALLLLFDGLESNPDNLIQELVQDLGTISTLILCLVNGLFYSVFTILFLAWPPQPNRGE